ncbi:MAG: MBOAT family O-acyltransferase [Catonella sp.]|nr:MBOAT family O-acyltransferase [Catonella sp.]MDY6355725.1 MBOAT family O-acyltransferase [Catonella sp.]
MTLFSVKFVIFFAISLILYYVLPKKWQNIMLAIFSYFFIYEIGGEKSIFFLSFSIVITYISALTIEKEQRISLKKFYFISTLTVNFMILLCFKYLNFFIGIGNTIFNVTKSGYAWEKVNFIAPLGITFYTLQIVGYLSDVYMQIYPAERNFLKYLTYSSFYPQIMSGPINKFADVGGQYSDARKFEYKNFTFGLQRIAWGLFKKFVISERLVRVVNTVYGDFRTYEGAYIFVATLLFGLQLYTDFSGSMDIFLGIADCYGIRLQENFKTPFFSKTVPEFWRRWHITLGAWFKDYVFYPMLKSPLFIDIGTKAREKYGKKRGKKIPVFIALTILWFLTGFWHGGLWKYIFGSGLIPCFYTIIGQLFEDHFRYFKAKHNIDDQNHSYVLFQRIRTYILWCSGLIFFRANSFIDGLRLCKHMLKPNFELFTMEGITSLGLDIHDVNITVYALLILYAVEKKQEHEPVREFIAQQNIFYRWIVYLALIFSIIIFGMYGSEFNAVDFIYAGF